MAPDPHPRRSRLPDDAGTSSAFLGEDGSLMLAAYEAGWQTDAYWLSFSCAGEQGCHRIVDLGIRPAIARFGRTMTIRGIARRLRCSECGGRTIIAQVSADCRGASARDRDGPAPQTLANLA
ncbi:hypothetical protein J5Y09_04375 [Roseomonas sp. PWR1]|uniref:Uncharacterized protein n=1 Tax=Roseomonas nitratireducens TaxID=2820810 RepID=A0ABS4AQM7_9PROT|nr:hypothetical protein [Neoroseomonas nitratireducens]MBP0463136.1 hypothetical protein [Neoroseomonas nitratireducens]